MSLKKSFAGFFMVLAGLAVIPLNCTASWGALGFAPSGAVPERVEAVMVPAGPAGTFEGEYTSGSSGSVGRLHIELREETGKWSGDVSAAYNGADLPCKVLNVDLNDSKLALTFSANVEGNGLQVVLSGTLTGDNWSGTYEATSIVNGNPMDSGTWKAARK